MNAVAVFLWFCGATLIAPSLGNTAAVRSEAQRWGDWAVSLAADPQLGTISFETLREKLSDAVKLRYEGDGIWSGRNPPNGILAFRVMFWTDKQDRPVEFDQLVLLMPVKDRSGNRLFPTVCAGMRHRLLSPGWTYSTGPNHCEWRHREKVLNVIVDEGNFGGPEGQLAGPPPYLVVIVNKDDPNGD